MLTKFRLVQRVAARMTCRCKLYDALQIKLYALKLYNKMHVDDTWAFEGRRGELSWKSSVQFFQSRIDWPGESERGTLYVDGQNKTLIFHQKDGHVFAYACVILCDFWPQGMLIRAYSSHYLLESCCPSEISKHKMRAGGSLTLSS